MATLKSALQEISEIVSELEQIDWRRNELSQKLMQLSSEASEFVVIEEPKPQVVKKIHVPVVQKQPAGPPLRFVSNVHDIFIEGEKGLTKKGTPRIREKRLEFKPGNPHYEFLKMCVMIDEGHGFRLSDAVIRLPKNTALSRRSANRLVERYTRSGHFKILGSGYYQCTPKLKNLFNLN